MLGRDCEVLPVQPSVYVEVQVARDRNLGQIGAGQKKSISLEEAVWRSLKEIATNRDLTLLDLLTNIASTEDQRNLSSAIRLFVLNFYREQLELQHIQRVVQAALRSPVQALH